MKVVRLSGLRTGRLYPPGNIPGAHFCQSRPHCQNAAGRIMSMQNSKNTIGNRTLDLPTCSAAPQPTAAPRTNNCTVQNTEQNNSRTAFKQPNAVLKHFQSPHQ